MPRSTSRRLATILALLLAAPLAAMTLDVSAGRIHLRLAAGAELVLVPEPVIVRDAAGSVVRVLAPSATRRDARSVRTHDGIVEIWGPGRRSVEIDAAVLAGLTGSDTVMLGCLRHRPGLATTRITTSFRVASWHDAGSPDPFVLELVAAEAGRQPRSPGRDVPRTLALADCPPDLTVECDGAGNVLDEQAWLDRFGGTPDAPCGSVTRTLDVQEGGLVPILTFDHFGDLSAWTLNGRAATIGNPSVDDAARSVLRLTQSFFESGSAFVSAPVTLADDSSFRAFFTFRISAPGGAGDADGPGADGLAFVLQSVADTAGGAGGGLGYQGLPRSVAVELDTYDNSTWDDFDGNHVGIDVDGNVDSLAQAALRPRFNDGDVWSAWVDYDGATDRLEARVDPTGTRPPVAQVTATLDIPTVLQGTDAFVGFTSGTGSGLGTHDILSFVFEAYAPVRCPLQRLLTVTSTITDECGVADACTRTFRVTDTLPPKLVPEAPVAECGRTLAVEAGPDGTASASARVAVLDACSTAVVRNDRTAGGADATDVYPCGVTPVRFDATDECGNASSCVLHVSVAPASRPPDVGAALRVRKDASRRPVLDWSLAGHPGEHAILASDGVPWPRPHARSAAGTWTESPSPAPLRWFDVRSVDCSGALSAD